MPGPLGTTPHESVGLRRGGYRVSAPFSDRLSTEERFPELPAVVRDFLREEIAYEPTMPWPHGEDSVTKRWVYRESGLPWLKLPLDIPVEEMHAEALNVMGRLVFHRSGAGVGWRSICLRGLSAEQTLGPKAYGYSSDREVPYRWTEITEMCPITTAFFQQHFACRTLYRVRFMLLEPGGYIAPHRDRTDHHLSGMNIALNNPPGCIFRMRRAGTIPISAGDGLLLDIANEHAVVNLSDEPRMHMIVHCADPTDRWNEMVCNAYREHIKRYPVAGTAVERETITQNIA